METLKSIKKFCLGKFEFNITLLLRINFNRRFEERNKWNA